MQGKAVLQPAAAVRGRRGEGAQTERRDDGARFERFERDGKRSSRFAAKAPHGDAPASPNPKAPRGGERGPARSDAADIYIGSRIVIRLF